jgi:endonuclease G
MNTWRESFLDINFLHLAQAASSTVGRVIRYNSAKGNGFMISNRLFLTSNHIVHDDEDAELSTVEFGYELDQKRRPKPTTKFKFAPKDFLIKSPKEDLDFTIVAIGERVSGKGKLTDFGFCPLKRNDDKYSLGELVNIIQHPGLDFKKIALRNNRLVAQSDDVLQYHAAVISGSSGSPVFNDKFEPIALHHRGSPSRQAFTQDGKPGPAEIAEGIRISAIVKKVEIVKSKLNLEQRFLIDSALSCSFSYPSLALSKIKHT